DWENAFAFRLGGQYDVTEEIPLRLGFAYDRTPIPDETVNASLPDNDRLVGTAGLGYQTGSFRADLAYSVVQTIPRDIDNDRAPTGEYATRAHLVALSLGYSFE
ncbi:MAG: OmpP1/FadL family transporter, partial [Persicimonas sp.]